MPLRSLRRSRSLITISLPRNEAGSTAGAGAPGAPLGPGFLAVASLVAPHPIRTTRPCRYDAVDLECVVCCENDSRHSSLEIVARRTPSGEYHVPCLGLFRVKRILSGAPKSSVFSSIPGRVRSKVSKPGLPPVSGEPPAPPARYIGHPETWIAKP